MTTFSELVRQAADHNSVLPEEIVGRVMDHDVIRARFQVCWVLRQSGWPYTVIGRHIGRDHTSVINAVRKAPVASWMQHMQVGPLVGTNRPVVTPGMPVTSPDTTAAAGGVPGRSGATTEPDTFIEDESPSAAPCMDCDGPAMPGGTVRCLDCFHAWLDSTKGRWRGTSTGNLKGAGHEAVRQVRLAGAA